ncbi:MAG: dihydrofolate reductase family protein [Bacteroidota bacterium]
MRKIVLNVAVSLDGLIEGPNGEYDWCFTDQDYGLTDFFNSIDTIFMGRKSYEVAVANDGMNMWKGVKTYVFSNTLTESPSKDVKIIRSMDEVATILQEPGKNIWLFGGAELTTAFINNKLVDELWLSVHPIVLGSGKPLFQNIDTRKNFKLIDTITYSSGLITLKYSQS